MIPVQEREMGLKLFGCIRATCLDPGYFTIPGQDYLNSSISKKTGRAADHASLPPVRDRFSATALFRFGDEAAKVFDGELSLIDRPALDGEDDVPLRLGTDANDPRPIDHTLTTGAAYRSAGHLPAF